MQQRPLAAMAQSLHRSRGALPAPEVARGIIGTMPLNPFFVFDEFSRKQLGVRREQIDVSGDDDRKFVLEKQGSQWLAARFRVDN